jgi:uncharacterized YccA/Bax inhibitor family protein
MRRSSRRGMFQSGNPVMTEKAYQAAARERTQGETMTVNGAVNKTFLLATIMLATSLFSYMYFNPVYMWIGAIGGLVVVLIAAFRPHLSPTMAPLYAALEGLFVGSISLMYSSMAGGIIFKAVTLTLAMLFMMLFVYKSGFIKVTNKFRSGIIMATGAVFLVYMLNFILSLFGVNMPFLHDGGIMSIGISLVIIGIAGLNLLLDFDNFEKGEQYGAQTYMEWFSAMGLIITLVWLYVEILRLLAILNSSD